MVCGIGVKHPFCLKTLAPELLSVCTLLSSWLPVFSIYRVCVCVCVCVCVSF